ncbi:hypothetical protein [Marinobacter sp. MBR-105]|jgi:hypothetical protein
MTANAEPQKYSQPIAELNVFNAGDRFYAARRQLEYIGTHLEELHSTQDPGVLDLCVQFSMLRALANKVAGRFESYDDHAKRQLKERDLKLIKNLEHLIYDFQNNLKDARKELLAA